MPPRRIAVEIRRDAYAMLLAEAAAQFPFETGGILLGTWSARRHALVSVVIGPGPDAVHERTSFDPDQRWQEQAVAEAWTEHLDGIDYLGDWHTHPNGRTKASKDDLAAARLIAAAPEARNPRPIILTVAIAGDGSVGCVPHVLVNGRLIHGSLTVQCS